MGSDLLPLALPPSLRSWDSLFGVYFLSSLRRVTLVIASSCFIPSVTDAALALPRTLPHLLPRTLLPWPSSLPDTLLSLSGYFLLPRVLLSPPSLCSRFSPSFSPPSVITLPLSLDTSPRLPHTVARLPTPSFHVLHASSNPYLSLIVSLKSHYPY